MPIDLSKVQWDDAPKMDTAPAINPAAVQWDNAPTVSAPAQNAVMSVGAGIAPEQSSQILDIQKKTGLPPAFIERNLEPIKQKLVQADTREFARLNPSTGAWLAESPYNTALALDDFENMGAMERLTNIFKPVPALAASGVVEAGAGAAGLFGFNNYADKLRADVAAVRNQVAQENPLEPGSWSESTRNALTSIYSQAPAYAIGILTGGATIPLTMMGTQAGLQKTSELEAGGVGKLGTIAGGVVSGLSEAGTELIPFKSLMGKNILKFFLTEQLGEQVNTVVDSVIDKVSIDPDMTWPEYIDRAVATAKTTLIQSGIMGGGMGAVNLATRKPEQPQVKTEKQFVEEIGKLAEASKLRERSPEKFQEAVSRLVKGTEAENVYIPVEAWNDYWQKQGVEPSVMAQELGVNPDAYMEAVANNGPLQVATDAYARKIGPTEHNAFFADEVKLKPEGMNAREFKDYMAKPENFEEPTLEEVQVQDANQVETAIFDLVAEGKDLEAITDEDISAKIESYGQAPVFYHATSKKSAELIKQEGFKAQIGERSLGVTEGKGVFLYKEDKDAAEIFGTNITRVGETLSIIETNVEGQIFDAKEDDRSIRELAGDIDFIEKLKKEGYVGVEGDEMGTPVTFIFEPTAIKVKPVRPVAEQGISEAGVTPEQGVAGQVGGESMVYRDVFDQLQRAMPAGTPETNIQAQATLWDSFFKTMGQRAGIAPEELYKKYSPLISRGNLQEAPKTLADFVRTEGGISSKDEMMKGEVKDRFSIKSGFNLVNNKTGQTLDRLAEAAWESGYFKERPSVSEFLDALREDVDAKTNKTGKAVVSYEGRDLESELDAEFAKHMESNQGELMQDDATGEMVTPEEWSKRYFQSAYHGTPHKFDKFTLDHIGKGEGAQAYGWGLYFAENKDVAEWYREKLSADKVGGAKILKDGPNSYSVWGTVKGSDQIQIIAEGLLHHQALQAKEKYDNENKGRLYKVNLTPEKDEYLDWDKPLSEQSEKVGTRLTAIKNALGDFIEEVRDNLNADFGEWTGRELYYALSKYAEESPLPGEGAVFNASSGNADQDASLYLKSIGIPGIKYLEGASRAKGEGHHNFVIFDEELIQIEEYEQAQRGRITFGPEGVNIELLKGADASTFLHETGHLYLKIMGDLAQANDAPAELRKDLDTLLKWFKVKSVKDIQTKHHEKFARGFEKYLAEGKAPSAELRSAFEQFKNWLIEVYKNLKSLNVSLTPEVTAIMDRMLATKSEIQATQKGRDVATEAVTMKSVLPTAAVKGQVRRATGLQTTAKMIREDEALSAAWKKAEQASREAFKAGKVEESAKWKTKLQEVKAQADEKTAKILTEKQRIARRRQSINTIVEYLGLTDAQVKKLTASKKDIRLMSDWEFKQFKDDLLVRAVELQETNFGKARVAEVIERKRLKNTKDYSDILGYPSIDEMTTEQLHEFADILEMFADGDVFLTERKLEVVDRTELEGARTWREVKERLAKESGVSMDELNNIKVSHLDMLRWDNALADQNPFYGLLVEKVTKTMMNAEMSAHEIENRVYELAKKSNKSRSRGIVGRLMPQDKQIFEYLEASVNDKGAFAAEMTPEQLDLAHYIQEYFARALEYLIKTNSLQKGRENYFVHIRRSVLENIKEDGLVKAMKEIYKNYQLDEVQFGILSDSTGNILPNEKFFQFSMQRTGALDPTYNVVKAFLTYAKTFEKKVALDSILPELDLYAQALTPIHLTPRGLEIDRSLKQFVYKYVNNKKGRQIDFSGVIKQGGPVDLALRGLRAFTTVLDLGLSIPVGLGTYVGEQAATFVMLGPKDMAKGTVRIKTAKGKAILNKYEAFVGRSVWEEFTAPGKEITDNIMTGLFGFFHSSSVLANKQYLLGSLTEQEYDSGEISPERLAQMKIELGRFRVVPGSKSIFGSTSLGSALMQYKSWAAGILRTTTKDITTLAKDLKNKKAGEALTTREAHEIYRIIGVTTTALIVFGMGDDDDKSFVGRLAYKIRSESLSMIAALSPVFWTGYPRIWTFMRQLASNLQSLAMLEEYKTKPGLKGAEGLIKQFTPGAFRGINTEEKPQARRSQ